jgi:Transcriptional regulator, AbiEi antitoxin
LANRQYGIVSIGQLSRLGYSQDAVKRAVVFGRIHRLHHGVYAVGHTNLSDHGWCLAGALACGPGALLSHYSAAWLWGIWKGRPLPVEVTGPVRRAPRGRLVVHHSVALTEADRALQEDIPVTAVPRTLLDLAARDRRGRLRRYMERAEELDLLDLQATHELLDRTKGHHGWGRLRRAAAFYEPPPFFTRSTFELRVVAAVLEAGLPQPSVNCSAHGYELDLYWPERRFAVELDTYGTHGTHEAFERDRLRAEDLLVHGIAMTRVTDVRFHREPDAVIARVKHLLEGRPYLPM